MKVLAPVFLYLSFALARIIDGSTLTTTSGPNVVPSSTSKVITLTTYDYVIVGSGAGGAPVAVRLALAGYSVLLVEAGTDQSALPQYLTPGMHPVSTEVEPMRWDYFIKSYDSDAENRKSEKMTYTTSSGGRYTGATPPSGATSLGLLYPRAGTLGGCTSHNALIAITPHNSDWTYIQNVTGDAAWAPSAMRKYLTRLEKNSYVANGTSGHGFSGWLDISLADPSVATEDAKTLQMVTAAANVLGQSITTSNISTADKYASFLPGDANSVATNRDGLQSLYRVPISMRPSYQRSGPVDWLKSTSSATNTDGTAKYKLDIMLNTLATKITFNTSSTTPRATGINFLVGASLYGADPRRQSGSATGTGKAGTVVATKEVIISAGVFNTPQLLKLSGIGPAAELASFSIPVVKDLPGVGKNLHDRYEAPVVALASDPFATIANCTFLNTANDPCYTRWQTGAQGSKGLYGSNGAPVAYTLKSSQATNGDADIFLLGLPGVALTGYYPGWAANATFGYGLRAFSWVSLKAHSRNTAGTVTLRNTNPQSVPEIAMRNFAVGGTEDIAAAVTGTKWARSVIQKAISNGGNYTEVWPGASVQTDAQWQTWLKGTTWGHHACCTAKIGATSDTSAVLDSKFRVRGVTGLRVVDASAFPKIPGYYIVLPLYMLSERAADDILAAA